MYYAMIIKRTNMRQREHNKRHHAKRRSRLIAQRKSNKRIIVDMFGNKCARCGGKFDQCVFDFHHLEFNKDRNIASLLNMPIKIIIEEAKKCIMVCANCHRIIHSEIGSGVGRGIVHDEKQLTLFEMGASRVQNS